MDSKELGSELTEAILAMGERELPRIHELVGRNRLSTKINLLVALGWVAGRKVGERLPEHVAVEVIGVMFRGLSVALQAISGWGDPEVQRLIRSRCQAYENCTEMDRDHAMLHTGHYFIACCQDMRIDVEHDGILPDAAELEQLPGANPRFVEQLKALQESRGCPTYTMDAFVTMEVVTKILSGGAAVDELLKGV